MILYMSNATAYPIYNELFRSGKIVSGYQMQKFNSNLIVGLGRLERIVALSALPYAKVPAKRIDQEVDGIRYIGIKNCVGLLHKLTNPLFLYLEGCRIIKDEQPKCIVCDAIAESPCYISLLLGRQFHVPVVGIITDIPGMLDGSKDVRKDIGRMQHFDGYILLTQQMDAVVNPRNKPNLIMEGLCAETLPNAYHGNKKKILIYSGSLWKKNAGIEYLIEGFLKANVPGFELHFYGTGELTPWIEEMSRMHPQIQYKGCVTNSEIIACQCEASLLINPRPSNEEFCKYSFPSKTIEYMASGTPVLMTKLPGIPQEYFQYVYTIENETADGMCEVLRQVLNIDETKRHAMGMRARDYVKMNKSCQKQCKRIYDFLEITIEMKEKYCAHIGK